MAVACLGEEEDEARGRGWIRPAAGPVGRMLRKAGGDRRRAAGLRVAVHGGGARGGGAGRGWRCVAAKGGWDDARQPP